MNIPPTFVLIHDIVDPQTGKTYRETNLELQHNIPVGALVEIIETGVRLFVVSHDRDCDGTPLYSLTPFIQEDQTKWTANKSVHGYPEDALKVVSAHPD